MRRSLIALGFAALVALGLYLCTFTVEESEAVIVLHLGRPVRVVREAGLHWKLPGPVQSVVWVDLRLQLLAPPPVEYLTADKKNLLVDTALAFRVVDPLLYVEAVGDVEGAQTRLRELLRSQVGAALGRSSLGDLVNLDAESQHLEELNLHLGERCNALSRESFGIAVEMALVRRIMFPPQNLGAVYRRMAAERERIAKRYLAEGEEQAMRIRSDADLEAEQTLSTARKEAQILVGRTEAEVAELYGRTFSKDPELYGLLKRLEVYDAALEEGSTVVLDSDSPLMELLRSGRLE